MNTFQTLSHYQGMCPNNPSEKITINVLFADNKTQTFVFTQPDTSGMSPLVASVNVQWGCFLMLLPLNKGLVDL
ncbi:MAG: hypothetical protein HQM10_09055 [Candidatus Riflebacteria bacterium]|nr:hypothetical protein [Candidatus Riflebacteria bacterium]